MPCRWGSVSWSWTICSPRAGRLRPCLWQRLAPVVERRRAVERLGRSRSWPTAAGERLIGLGGNERVDCWLRRTGAFGRRRPRAAAQRVAGRPGHPVGWRRWRRRGPVGLRLERVDVVAPGVERRSSRLEGVLQPERVLLGGERIAQRRTRPQRVVLPSERVVRPVLVHRGIIPLGAVLTVRAHRAPPRAASVASLRSVVVVSSSAATGAAGGAALVGLAMAASAVSSSRPSITR